MKAYKSGLTPYLKGNETVYASKVMEVIPYHLPMGECVTLVLEIGKEVNLIPSWKEQHNPKVGGYFVVQDVGDPYYVPSGDFAQQFRQP